MLYLTVASVVPQLQWPSGVSLRRMRADVTAVSFFSTKNSDESAADEERILFLKSSEIKKRGYDTLSRCISAGLFPLEMQKDFGDLNKQWMNYIDFIRDKKFYRDGILPNEEELHRRKIVLQNAFSGIIDTNVAVYIVPSKFMLDQICEIFEVLNTTGTKVSTVDLVHSVVYAETLGDAEGPTLIRDWISDLGQRDGAIGWASRFDRPELVAQIVTACYVAQESSKAEPRKTIGGEGGAITSIKSGDLLSTPTAHWKSIISNTEQVAQYLRDFQFAVANGLFPLRFCPCGACARGS